MENKNQVRLQKYLSANGVASRRKAEQMILDGAVKVNGKTALIGDKVTPGKDKVAVSGRIISPAREKKRYITLHKPRGFVTTMDDEKGRKCVADLIREIPERVYPVGRLDRDSEGLLIMTNDGDFANDVVHPSKHIEKTYRATIKSEASDYLLAAFVNGVEIDGRKTAPAKVKVVSEEPGRSVLEITIEEGRNRQIRKICESVGVEVARLKRISIGGVKLGTLPPGKWRNLTEAEFSTLIREKP